LPIFQGLVVILFSDFFIFYRTHADH
jgi:hypothetical protein